MFIHLYSYTYVYTLITIYTLMFVLNDFEIISIHLCLYTYKHIQGMPRTSPAGGRGDCYRHTRTKIFQFSLCTICTLMFIQLCLCTICTLILDHPYNFFSFHYVQSVHLCLYTYAHVTNILLTRPPA
jgi:hypothetical protein